MHRTTLLLLPFLATGLWAQAPRITPAGDPSVRADTIYSLAVDPAKYPDEQFVYLLDDGVVRVEMDGRGSRTYRQIIQVFTREAAEHWGEQEFYHDPGREKLTLNWARVVGIDGKVISEKPSHEQESLSPAARESPVYTDQRVLQISLGGVAPGTIVDYSYTVETLQPLVPGDFFTAWRITTGKLTRRSRFLLDVPELMTPRIQERNLPTPRREVRSGSRRVYQWTATDVQGVEPEPFAADSNDVIATVVAAAPITWNTVAAWYANLSKDRYQMTPDLESKLSEVLQDASTQQDSLLAVHRWVAQDFRYVSLSLGIGGFQPRWPEEVLKTQFGDCKDKATLFITLVRRMGLTALPVLLNSAGGVDRSLPSGQQFDHMIAAVQRPNGYLFVDLTAELTPLGSLPPPEQGEFGLVVHSDGRGEEVTFPMDSASANRADVRIAGELTGNGVFTGRLTRSASGSLQYGLRSAFANTLSASQQSQIARAIANEAFAGATGDSLVAFNGRDLQADPKVSVVIHDDMAISKSGGTDIFTLPIRNYADPGMVERLRAEKSRLFPIDVGAIVGPVVETSELRLTLPEGWHARLPGGVKANSVFGSYVAEYSQIGREVLITRSITGQRGIQPPSQIGALRSWLEEISRDDTSFLLLDSPR